MKNQLYFPSFEKIVSLDMRCLAEEKLYAIFVRLCGILTYVAVIMWKLGKIGGLCLSVMQRFSGFPVRYSGIFPVETLDN